MSNPYPPPRRLERSSTNRVLGGVCAGIGEYFRIDPTLIRVLTVILTMISGAPVVPYLIAYLLMPEARRPGGPPPRPYAVPPPSSAPGPWPRTQEDQVVWGTEGAPWEQPQPATPPPSRYGDTAPGREPGRPGPT